jgi:O-antigen/teichoic acid export membrane protein
VRPAVGSLIARAQTDSLLRNSLFLIATTVVNSAFGYVFWLAAARLFSPATVGLASAIIAASTIISLIAQVGVGATLIQVLPQRRSPSAWWLSLWTVTATATAISLVLGCAALLVLAVLSRQFSGLTNPAYVGVLVIGTVGSTAGNVLDSAFVAERAAGAVLGRNSVVAGGKAVALLLLSLVAAKNVLALLDAWAVAAVAGIVVGVALVIRKVGSMRRPRLLPLIQLAREFASRAVGNQFIGIGGAVPPLLLPLLVTARLTASENAYFYTTWMMCGMLLVISPAIARSLFAEGVHSPADLRAKTRSALAILGVLLVPSMIIFLLVGGSMLSTFGSEYESHAIDLLRLIVLSAVPDAVTNVYVAGLQVQNRLARAAWLNLGMGVGTLVLSWVLLPVLGITAVGWAWLGMQTAGCVVVAVSLSRGGQSPTPQPATVGAG